MSEDATIATRPAPIQPGDLAPEFTLPALERDGSVSLADYRGRSPLFLALFIGLWTSDRPDGHDRGQAQGGRQVPPDPPAPGRRPDALPPAATPALMEAVRVDPDQPDRRVP